MIIFEKNGQGAWDFDFQELEKLTSLEFASRVKEEFDLIPPTIIEHIETKNTEYHYTVVIVTSARIYDLTYFTISKRVLIDSICIHLAEMMLDKKKRGEF